MAKFYTALNKQHIRFIQAQKMFFTASAPDHGRVNLSPKGMDTFRVLDNNTAAYLDLTGSGNETSAHILENGRLTVMFCSFDAEPLILRLYGHAEVIGKSDRQWESSLKSFKSFAGIRQIIMLHIDSVQTSCGFAVPQYRFLHARETLQEWAEKKGPEKLADYQKEKNSNSIDGLPTHLGECSE